jgi:phospholipase A1
MPGLAKIRNWIIRIIPLLFLAANSAQAEEAIPFLRTLEPYKPIYLLNSWFLDNEGEKQGYDNREVVLQFGFKKQLLGVLYFGFTYKAFWQIYDLGNSRPFREQDYNPELFLEFTGTWGIDVIRLGLAEHESNGEKQSYTQEGKRINYSRTWDRSYLYLWQNLSDYFALGCKAWVVTSSRSDEYRAFYDDNPDIQYYLGSGELYAVFGRYPAVLTLMLRRGWLDETETYKIEGRLPLDRLFDMDGSGHDIYFQYFNGYGDSLIDYNRRVTRFALGVSFR